MSIVSRNRIKVDGYEVKLKHDLKFYYGDTLNLSFSISNEAISQICSYQITDGDLRLNSDKIKAYMIVENKEIAGTIVEDNCVIFRLEPKYQTIGVSMLQIILKEDTGGGEVDILHTPPFPLFIEDPIAELDNEDIGGGNNTGGGNTGSITNIHEHWVSNLPPTSTEMIWIAEGIGSVNETIDVLVLQELKEIILNQNKKIDELERKIIALENSGSIIITDGVLLEDGSPLLMEDGDYLLLG